MKLENWKIFLFCFIFCFGIVTADYEEFREVGRGEALGLLIKAEGFVEDMESEGFSVFFEKDNLLDAKRYFIGKDVVALDQLISFEEDSVRKAYLVELVSIGEETPIYERKKQDYFQTAKLADIVIQRKTQAYRILDGISLFEERESSERENGIETGDAVATFEMVSEAFEGERYDEAESILEEANLNLDRAISENQKINSAIRATQGFFIKYWWQIILTIAVLVSISIPIGKRINRRLRERRLANLKTKLVLNRELLRSAQESCFNAKVINAQTYRIREKKYKVDRVKIENKIKILEKLLGKAAPGGYESGRGLGLVIKK